MTYRILYGFLKATECTEYLAISIILSQIKISATLVKTILSHFFPDVICACPLLALCSEATRPHEFW